MTAGPAADWFERYAGLSPLYTAFTERLESFLDGCAVDEGVYTWHAYPWVFRASDFEALVNRERRAGRTITDPFREIGGFAGVALVTMAPSELDVLAAIVERELAVDYAASRPRGAVREALERSTAAPRVDYPHAYFTVEVPERRRQLVEWRPYVGLRVEVHVLTVAQYAWWCLDMSHLPYYWETSYPPQTREAFARVAELLAEVDAVLEREEESRADIDAAYDDAVAHGDDVPLDVRSVAAYLRGSGILAELASVAEAEGMQPDDEPYAEPADTLLEQETLWLLKRNGITTLGQLDAFVRGALPRARSILRDIARTSTENGFVPFGSRESILTFLVLVLHRADHEQVELVEYQHELADALNAVIGNPVPGGAGQRPKR